MRTWRLDELAAFLGSEARGELSKMLTGACTIEKPENASVSFAQNKSQLESARRLVSNELGALIQPSNVEPLYETVILNDNPRLAFAWTQIAFHAPNWVELPPKAPMHDTSPFPLVGGEWRKPFGIDEKAKVSDGAIIAGDVEIGAFSIIEDGASLGEGAIIYPHVYIGKGVRIGRNCRVFPHVTIYAHSQIGDGVYIHSGTVIGADGFGFVSHDHGHTKLAQTGRVVIGDNVEIGANCCIDRAAIGDTVIEDGVKLDNLIQVAHGVRIGANTLVAAQAGFSGGMDIGKWCVIGGQAGFAGHASVGDCSIVAARAGVMGGLPAKSKVSGYPARPHKEQLRVTALTYRLPELFDQVKELMSKVSAMEDVNAVSNNRTDEPADGQAEDSNGAIYDGQDGVRDVDS